MIVKDEYDRRWEVLSTDPAWDVASRLKRRGFEEVSLYRNTICTGETPGADESRVHALLGAYALSDEKTEGVLAKAFLAACQLYDCCLSLAKEE